MGKERMLERLTQAVEYLKNKGKARKHEDIALLMNKPRPHVSAALKGDEKRLTQGFVKSFAAAYRDYINEEWLLTGKGEMAKPDHDQRPHFEARVAAGFLSGGSEQIMSPMLRDMITTFPKYDFTIDVEGDSMTPQIVDGDTICCRFLDDRLNAPVGRICVLDTKDGPAVKIIKEVTEDSLILHSLNPKYPDYPVELSSINRVALVIGVLRILNP